MNNKKHSLRWIITGLLFTILWASASTATKKGLEVAQPLTIAIARFAIAAACMLVVAHIFLKYPLPRKKQWYMLSVYGLLNITIYLGLYVLSMQTVTAGIGALAVATNPVFIGFLSVIFLQKKMTLSVLLALVLGITGVFVASYPLLQQANIQPKGLVLMLLSMLSYSVASIYFNKKDWGKLKILTINGWQTLIGGLFLLPFMIFYYRGPLNHLNKIFFGSVIWLAVFVSIFAIQCWLWLLKQNPVKAGLLLFLCPVFGFIIAAFFIGDTISAYTIAGILLVISALWLSHSNKEEKEIFKEDVILSE